MNLLLWLWACGGGPTVPEGAPENASLVVVGPSDQITVGGRVVLDRDQVHADLADGEPPELVAALEGDGPIVIVGQPETDWVLVRKAVMSARYAERSPVFLSDGQQAWPLGSPPARGVGGLCPSGPRQVQGMARQLTLELFKGSHGTWLEASVRVLPVVDGRPMLSLPTECWAGASCAQAPNPDHCGAAESAAARIPVAGPVGCMLPIRKEPGQEAAWPAELAANLKRLGWTERDATYVILEAPVPWSAVTAVLGGVAQAELPQPALGLPLVEGHGSPPPCTAEVRDAAALDRAVSAWWGQQVAAATAADAPPAQGEPTPK